MCFEYEFRCRANTFDHAVVYRLAVHHGRPGFQAAPGRGASQRSGPSFSVGWERCLHYSTANSALFLFVFLHPAPLWTCCSQSVFALPALCIEERAQRAGPAAYASRASRASPGTLHPPAIGRAALFRPDLVLRAAGNRPSAAAAPVAAAAVAAVAATAIAATALPSTFVAPVPPALFTTWTAALAAAPTALAPSRAAVAAVAAAPALRASGAATTAFSAIASAARTLSLTVRCFHVR